MTDGESEDSIEAAGIEWYTKRFWEALQSDKFLIGDCPGCGEAHFPPAPVCPHCGVESDMTKAEGNGTLYSFTRQHRTAPAFDSPITIGTVELAEGPRVLMRIKGPYEPLHIGMDVEILTTEYREDFDRRELSGYPMFIARPL